MQIGNVVVVDGLAQARYEIRNHRYQSLIDFDKGTVTLRGHGWTQIYQLSEYENYDGDMEAFLRSKLGS